MNMGKLVFAQIMEHLPRTTFGRCVARYGGEHKVKTFSCLDQYLCMAFAQLTYRESLRDSEACLRAQEGKLYHMGIRGSIARNTLANANAVRDWRVYADLAQSLIGIARRLYAGDPFGVDLKETVYVSLPKTRCVRTGDAILPRLHGRRCPRSARSGARPAHPFRAKHEDATHYNRRRISQGSAADALR
jgi:hypothetical protein